jgi:hypothetical protein
VASAARRLAGKGGGKGGGGDDDDGSGGGSECESGWALRGDGACYAAIKRVADAGDDCGGACAGVGGAWACVSSGEQMRWINEQFPATCCEAGGWADCPHLPYRQSSLGAEPDGGCAHSRIESSDGQ